MAMNFNKVELAGRLVKDPEIKTTANNNAVATFTVAVNRKYTKKGENPVADFFNVVAWRSTAEFVTKNFTKGSAIFISGTLQQRSWKDKDGNNRYAIEVVAEEVSFVESKKTAEAPATPTPVKAAVPTQVVAENVPEGFVELTVEDDLPF